MGFKAKARKNKSQSTDDGAQKKKSSSGQDEEEDWGTEFGADWEKIPDGTIHTDVNWGPEFANPVAGAEDGAFKITSSNRTLLLAKGGPEVVGEQEAAKIYGIDFDDEVWLNDRARGNILYRDDRKRELQVHAMEILEHRPISPTIGLCANFDM